MCNQLMSALSEFSINLNIRWFTQCRSILSDIDLEMLTYPKIRPTTGKCSSARNWSINAKTTVVKFVFFSFDFDCCGLSQSTWRALKMLGVTGKERHTVIDKAGRTAESILMGI